MQFSYKAPSEHQGTKTTEAEGTVIFGMHVLEYFDVVQGR